MSIQLAGKLLLFISGLSLVLDVITDRTLKKFGENTHQLSGSAASKFWLTVRVVANIAWHTLPWVIGAGVLINLLLGKEHQLYLLTLVAISHYLEIIFGTLILVAIAWGLAKIGAFFGWFVASHKNHPFKGGLRHSFGETASNADWRSCHDHGCSGGTFR